MRKLKIEWKHYSKEGETCTRCNNTGDNIKKAIEILRRQDKYAGIAFDYTETELSAEKMPESNSIIIDGILIENVLGLKASENHCHSCTCLEGADTNCKTIVDEKRIYEEVPAEFIVLAIEKSLS
jgi:hypothetical protein